MVDVKDVLDQSVYGHEKAKQQIYRIIGQWINGEQSGYCFGFEGPPGVGKPAPLWLKCSCGDCIDSWTVLGLSWAPPEALDLPKV